MNKAKALAILKELQKRKGTQPSWLNPKFLVQNDFINDTSRLKAVQCTRRAGKSYGAGLYAFKEAYENPGVSVVICGQTRDSIKRIFWKDILTDINNKLNIGAVPNRSDLTFTLPNGSIIYLMGVGNNQDDMDKLLGQKLKLVIIDEAAFYRIDMHRLVYEILNPAMIDLNGTIALISTTSHLTSSLYYDITTGKKRGWSVHKWTALDNPFMKKAFEAEKAELIKNDPLIVETPLFKRMYCNEWVIDTDALVYRASQDNLLPKLPKAKAYKYVLGIDLGYDDDTAFVVCAYSKSSPNLYVVETFNKSKMIIDDVAKKIRELNKQYKFASMIVDGASKQAVQEIVQRHKLPLVPTEKQGKRDYIELLNSDLITNKIKILPKAEDLYEEWQSLIWDEKKKLQGTYAEHPSCPNHLSDAFLYAWRYVYNYTFKPKQVKPHPTTEEAVDQFWEEQAGNVKAAKLRMIREKAEEEEYM